MTQPADIPIQFLKGVGPAKAKLFNTLGVNTVEDVLHLFPRRYEDRRHFIPIRHVKAGQAQTASGKVLVGGGRVNYFSQNRVFEIVLGDSSGRISCVWFNQPFLKNIFKVDQEVVVYGRVELYKNKLQFMNPEFEIISTEDRSVNMGRIVPIYPLTRGLSQKYLRKVMGIALEHAGRLKDVIPEQVRARQGLPPISQSIHEIHYPSNEAAQQKSLDRIAFDEFFLFQISIILRRLSIVQKKGIAHAVPEKFFGAFERALPFALTAAQKKAMQEMALDMGADKPMLRLVQGDVGSGKTMTAFFGAAVAYANKNQTAIMAPTEILAQQHFHNLNKLAGQGPFKGMKAAMLISSLSKKNKTEIAQAAAEGKVDVLIGTHALIEEAITFKNLSLIVIDEQHKFGVNQRALLAAKGANPDVLVMTATPIPRTLCLTLYGDLDVSTINEMPPGRGKISTYHFPAEKAQAVYEKVREMVKKGTQAYIIYPLVEESEKLDLKAAAESFEHFKQFEFADLRIALVHGQMPRADVDEIMTKFKNHEIDILVATTILEVGIDVPNANVMVIEHAERFGLSQLHQMRGRIGRSSKDAVCILLGHAVTEDAKARLDAIVKTTDGFKIAECDLAIRGPGHYFGHHQHGLNELKVANPATQLAILEQARGEAIQLVRTDPGLQGQEHRMIKDIIQKRYPQYLEFIVAG